MLSIGLIIAAINFLFSLSLLVFFKKEIPGHAKFLLRIMVVAGIIGGAMGAIGFLMGVDEETLTVLAGIIGFAIGLLSQPVVIRMILNRDYGEFRLALVPNSPVTVPPDLANSP